MKSQRTILGMTWYEMISCITWGTFCAKQQFKRTPKKYGKIVGSFLLNFTFPLIGMIIAIFKK